jgi:hypothetical protein
VAVRVSTIERCVFAGVVRRERALSAGKTVECSGACAHARSTVLVSRMAALQERTRVRNMSGVKER